MHARNNVLVAGAWRSASQLNLQVFGMLGFQNSTFRAPRRTHLRVAMQVRHAPLPATHDTPPPPRGMPPPPCEETDDYLRLKW